MNYKIEVENKEQADEAESMAQTLGYKMDTMFSEEWSKKYCYLLLCSDMSAGFGNELMANGDEPMSMTELRALVSLHKNPINMDKVLSEVRSDALGLLEDKEYLRGNAGGTYSYVGTVRPDHVHDFLIEIPDGANYAYQENGVNGLTFFKDDSNTTHNNGEWFEGCDVRLDYVKECEAIQVWQRHTHPEELPFVDDEPSLNDQYAEIEQVRQASITDTLKDRQSTYGSFEDVALTTQKIMDAIAWARGQDKLPAPHHEALHMIASKMARIVNGDCNYIENWHDISGYATLIERELETTEGATNAKVTRTKIINGIMQEI